MKTLQEIKDKYAIEQGYEDWEYLLRKNYWNDGDIELHWTEICIRAQKEALEKAAKSGNRFFKTAEMRDLETQLSKEEISYSRMIEIINEKADVFYRTSIPNEQNLIR